MICLFSPRLSHLRVPLEPREGRQTGVCLCARVCLCTLNASTHEKEEKRAKTDRDKEINRRIEIDRLTETGEDEREETRAGEATETDTGK